MAGPVRASVPLDVSGGLLVASGSYTADADIQFDRPFEAVGVIVVIDWTVETDAGASIAYTLQGKVPNADTSIVWAISPAVTVTQVGTNVIQVHPSLLHTVPTADADGLPYLAVAGVGNALVPSTLNLNINAADTKAVIYSVHVYFTF